MDEDDLKDLEARVRALWPDIDKPRERLDEEAKAVATKLMGKSRAERLARGDKPFRYRPRMVRAEYHYVPPLFEACQPSISNGGFWAVDVIEDGRRRRFGYGSWERCRFIIKAMEAQRITVDFVGGHVPKVKPKVDLEQSSRKELLYRAGMVRP